MAQLWRYSRQLVISGKCHWSLWWQPRCYYCQCWTGPLERSWYGENILFKAFYQFDLIAIVKLGYVVLLDWILTCSHKFYTFWPILICFSVILKPLIMTWFNTIRFVILFDAFWHDLMIFDPVYTFWRNLKLLDESHSFDDLEIIDLGFMVLREFKHILTKFNMCNISLFDSSPCILT